MAMKIHKNSVNFYINFCVIGWTSIAIFYIFVIAICLTNIYG